MDSDPDSHLKVVFNALKSGPISQPSVLQSLICVQLPSVNTLLLSVLTYSSIDRKSFVSGTWERKSLHHDLRSWQLVKNSCWTNWTAFDEIWKLHFYPNEDFVALPLATFHHGEKLGSLSLLSCEEIRLAEAMEPHESLLMHKKTNDPCNKMSFSPWIYHYLGVTLTASLHLLPYNLLCSSLLDLPP